MSDVDAVGASTVRDPAGRSADAPWSYAVVSSLVGVGSVALILVVTGSWTPTCGEPLLLRWLRVVADHPVRSVMGLAALTASLMHPSRLRKPRDDPGAGL